MTLSNVLLAAVSVTGLAGAAMAEPVRNVVLVHGAFADGSGWRPVAEILQADGFTVSIVQQPMTSIADDVAATNRILEAQAGPAVLVGHSYGGAVITEAGHHTNVSSLVYVAAFAPAEGDVLAAMSEGTPPAAHSIGPTAISWSTLSSSQPTSRLTFPCPWRSSWRSRRCRSMVRSGEPRSVLRLGWTSPASPSSPRRTA